MKGNIKRIVFFEGDIETVGYFARQMEKYFISQGYETFFFDYENITGSLKPLLKFLKRGETAVLTFNYHGLCGDSEVFYDEEKKEYIWDSFDLPCINIVVDHPLFYHRFFPVTPRRYIHVCIDKNHETYMEEYFPEIARGGFLPLAGTGIHEPLDAYKPIKERSVDLVFTANYVNPTDFDVYIERHGDDYAAFYRGILQELIDEPYKTLEEVAVKHMKREVPDGTHEEIKEVLGNMVFMDLYIRSYFRGEVMKRVVDAGYKVHCLGGGWDRLECEHPENLIMHGTVDSIQCLEMIADAKISLNVMPWFKEGGHDRIFNTMLNGAVCVTDSSNYLDDYLVDGENAAIYDLADLDKIPDIIADLLADEDKMQRMADAGYEMALKDHTWAHRAVEIEKIFESL